jgi:hypothetical protein
VSCCTFTRRISVMNGILKPGPVARKFSDIWPSVTFTPRQPGSIT